MALVAVFLILMHPGPREASAKTLPESLVKAFHADLLGVMKDGKNLKITGRYEKFLVYIDKYFHMPLMVQFVSGKHWNGASKDARISLVDAARRLSAAEMAVLFNGYGGESFRTDGTRSVQDGSVLVKTSLVRPDNGNVKVIYRTKKFGESWRIIDVILDGSISQLLKRRGEYNRTLQDSGINGLYALMTNKTDEILKSENK
ncbi:MAG: ABC transporter substrate-binding protein [Rhodospirillaceae bacterium]